MLALVFVRLETCQSVWSTKGSFVLHSTHLTTFHLRNAHTSILLLLSFALLLLSLYVFTNFESSIHKFAFTNSQAIKRKKQSRENMRCNMGYCMSLIYL